MKPRCATPGCGHAYDAHYTGRMCCACSCRAYTPPPAVQLDERTLTGVVLTN